MHLFASALPGLFDHDARAAYAATLTRDQAVNYGARVVLDGLNTVALDAPRRSRGRGGERDPRLRSGMAVIVPLSLWSPPSISESFVGCVAVLSRNLRERGRGGAIGLTADAALVVATLAMERNGDPVEAVVRATDQVLEAEILEALARGREAAAARGACEQRMLHASRSPRKAA